MNVEIIISEEFRFYTMNYALAQRKDVSELKIENVYKQWEHYKETEKDRRKK